MDGKAPGSPEILSEVANFFRILPSSLSILARSSSLPLQALISEMKFCNHLWVQYCQTQVQQARAAV